MVELLKLENLPRVSFEGMNEVHLKELKILNKLYGAIANKKPQEEIDKLLNEFIKDVEKHFSYEEEIMRKTSFFAYRVHKEEHDRVLKELEELKKIWSEKENPKVLKNYLEKVFLPWLIEHVQTMDTATATYISNFFGLNLLKK